MLRPIQSRIVWLLIAILALSAACGGNGEEKEVSQPTQVSGVDLNKLQDIASTAAKTLGYNLILPTYIPDGLLPYPPLPPGALDPGGRELFIEFPQLHSGKVGVTPTYLQIVEEYDPEHVKWDPSAHPNCGLDPTNAQEHCFTVNGTVYSSQEIQQSPSSVSYALSFRLGDYSINLGLNWEDTTGNPLLVTDKIKEETQHTAKSMFEWPTPR
jgi:hypothetical protein